MEEFKINSKIKGRGIGEYSPSTADKVLVLHTEDRVQSPSSRMIHWEPPKVIPECKTMSDPMARCRSEKKKKEDYFDEDLYVKGVGAAGTKNSYF